MKTKEEIENLAEKKSKKLAANQSVLDEEIPLKIRLKPSNLFQTYKEAEQACLDKLIEIVKSK